MHHQTPPLGVRHAHQVHCARGRTLRRKRRICPTAPTSPTGHTMSPQRPRLARHCQKSGEYHRHLCRVFSSSEAFGGSPLVHPARGTVCTFNAMTQERWPNGGESDISICKWSISTPRGPLSPPSLRTYSPPHIIEAIQLGPFSLN